MDFPQLLGKIMEDEGIKQPQLAKRCGVTQGAISKWMTRERAPKQDSQARLAEKLGVDLGILATAVAETKIEKRPSPTAQLQECEAQLKKLQRENARLRAQIQGGR